MLYDAGLLHLCALDNTAPAGDMPRERLRELDVLKFGELTVGMSRFYAAQGVNQRVDLMTRTWRCPAAQGGMYAVLSDSDYNGQYRISQVQHRLDDDGLKVTDFTLTRLERNYEVLT